MKSYNRICAAVFAVWIILTIIANLYLLSLSRYDNDRSYRVEVSRIAREIAENGYHEPDFSRYEYVTDITVYSGDDSFYNTDSDYSILKINDILYRFDYNTEKRTDIHRLMLLVNSILGIMILLLLAVMFYIRRRILQPFAHLIDVPYALSKGNLTAPIEETKNHFFGNFVWGLNMLREHMEQQKQRELTLQKEKKTLLLSLSHDIKTPLSAIKLYAKALSKGLYEDKAKQLEITEQINAKADEIEGFVDEIINASRTDLLSLDVTMGEFYLSTLLNHISDYYLEKLSLIKTDFSLGTYNNCLLKGDLDRAVEVLQNIMENAIKYGDGKSISLHMSEEEGCSLISVENTGCSLSEGELPHIFDSFFRGSNTAHQAGSGLGLYICRQLMHKMTGEIFAEVKDETMVVSIVFEKV